MFEYSFGNLSEVAPPPSLSCFINTTNSKRLFLNVYEGIPETLGLNLIAWIFLLLLFTLLRQQAWDYGRLALVDNDGDNRRWTQLFYAQGNEMEMSNTISSSNNGSGGGGGGVNSDTINSSSSNSGHSNDSRRNSHINGNIRNANTSIIDNGLFSWIWVTMKINKDNILMRSGPDAVHYLSFEQHLMFVMACITFISIVIILPVNFQGTLISGDSTSFGHTTISNLPPNSPLLWIHVIVAICYVPLVVLVMRRSSGRNAFKTAATKTIMATNISRADCNKTVIRNYIQELFPDREFHNIELAYNITKLTEIADEYERIVDARIYCEIHKNRGNIITVKPNCWTCKTIDALEYYQEKELNLRGEVARLRASALNSPLGIAFITVSSTEAAQDIIMHFKPGTYREWTLSYAPAPSDLYWENLSVSSGRWYVKWITVNFILFIFLFFLTTPIYLVSFINQFSKMTTPSTVNPSNGGSGISPLISEFLPTLMLMIFSVLMPVIVGFSDKWLNHWTRSKQNYSIMTKTFGFLLFMVLILPSLGLTSAQALFDWTINYNDSSTYRWDCIFLPDKGAFYVNYVITVAFIGTALELLRFPDLIVYAWMRLTAKSARAEKKYIRKFLLTEFPFGIHYAWIIMVFTITIVYSIACPLIMPFAMVYFILKYFGDRHNIYFAYRSSNMISQGGGKIHSTAVTMTKVSVILLLIILAALATVRKAGIDARAIVLILSLIVTLTLFTFMSPIKKCTTRRPSLVEPQTPQPPYIADVLLNRRIYPPSSSELHLGYGSDTHVDLDAYVNSNNTNNNNNNNEETPIQGIST